MESNEKCLRQEILESQKARSDFLKFKLISIATLAAAGLGLNGKGSILGENIDYVLCVIPLICIYVDLLCYHNNIRIKIIAAFFKEKKDEYESFIDKISKAHKEESYYFKLEDYVIRWSSIIISVLLIIYGLCLNKFEIKFKSLHFIIVGIVGVIISLIIKSLYNKRLSLLKKTKS